MRFFVPLLATAVLLVGCGADSGERASSTTDARALLHATSENLAQLKSAAVDLKAGGAGASGHVTGAFESAGAKDMPKFSFQGSVDAGGDARRAGATWTGSRGYVTLDGTAYEVPSLLVRQISAAYGQALPLRADLTRWVPEVRNAGMARVGEVDTVKLTGKAAVPRVLADLRALGAQLNVPGLGAGLPQGTGGALKDVTVTIYTGAEDQLLRRLVVTGDAASKPVVVDLTLTRVGAEQAISAPQGAKPFDQLLGKFGSLRDGSGLPIK